MANLKNLLVTGTGRFTDKVYASEFVGTATQEDLKASTADWNQNDPNANNYVKNRTHWVENASVTLLNNYDISSDYGTTPDGYRSIAQIAANGEDLPVKAGDICSIIFNGETFVYIVENDTEGLLIRDSNSNKFAIVITKQDDYFVYDIRFYSIPSTSPYITIINEKCVSLVDNVAVNLYAQSNGSGYSQGPFTTATIVEGATYIVSFNNYLFKCIAYFAEGPNCPAIGDGTAFDISRGNGEPFLIYGGPIVNGLWMLTPPEIGVGPTGVVNISIMAAEYVHKLDSKFIDTDVIATKAYIEETFLGGAW